MTAKTCQNCYHADLDDCDEIGPWCQVEGRHVSAKPDCGDWAPLPAAGLWRTDEPPRDGSAFLARADNEFVVLRYDLRDSEFWTFGWTGLQACNIAAWAAINPPPEADHE